MLANKATMLDVLSRHTGQSVEKISKDMDRMLYMTPETAMEYGIIDKILEATEADLPVPAGVS